MRTSGHAISPMKYRPEWGFVCGRISVLEGKLLSREFFHSLIEQHHTDDIFQHFNDTLIQDYLGPGIPWEDFSSVADQCFYDLAVSIREECPSPEPANLFLIQNDYLNIKSALSGMEGTVFLPGIMSPEKIESIADGDLSDLPTSFRQRVSGGALDLGELDESVSDIIVDGSYLRHLLALVEDIKSPLILSCVHDRVLAYAVSSMWRALRQGRDLKQFADYFIPIGEDDPLLLEIAAAQDPSAWPEAIGGEIGEILLNALQMPFDEQISIFELKVANALIHSAADARIETAGPERVYAFLAGFHAEIQNLKLVVSGRLNRIDRDVLAQRLRHVYG